MQKSIVSYLISAANFQNQLKSQVEIKKNIQNNRKLLDYLFNSEKQLNEQNIQKYGYRKISDQKLELIQSQYKYLSQMIHNDGRIKNTQLDFEIYQMQKGWLYKKIGQFYRYFFIKFAYANTLESISQIVKQQNKKIQKQNYTYNNILKAIQGRQICLSNIIKQGKSLKKERIEQDLNTIKQQINLLAKNKIAHQMQSNQYKSLNQVQFPTQRWKNKLQLFFQSLSHLRKLTVYVIQIIQKWKTFIYSLSNDSKKYAQRIIFYYNKQNYLLKILVDCRFLNQIPLCQYIQFSKRIDPFALQSLLKLQQKNKNQNNLIFYNFLKPNSTEIGKIIKSLQILGNQKYEQDYQNNNQKNLKQSRLVGYNNNRRKSQVKIGENNVIENRKKIYGSQKLLIQKININSEIKNMNQSQKNIIKKLNTQNKSKSNTHVGFTKTMKIGSNIKQSFNKTQKQKLQQLNNKFQNNKKIIVNNFRKTSMGNMVSNNHIQQNIRKIQQIQTKTRKNRINSALSVSQLNNKTLIQFKKMPVEQINKNTFNITKRNNIIKNVLQNNQFIQSKSKTKNFITKNIKKLNRKFKSPDKIQDVRNIKRTIQSMGKSNIKNVMVVQPQIILVKQQKIEQIRVLLYEKIKQQVIEEMRKNEETYRQNIRNLMQQQKRRRVNEELQRQRIAQQLRIENERLKELEQKQIMKNKIIPDLEVQCIQVDEQQLGNYIQRVFKMRSQLFRKVFNTDQVKLLNSIHNSLYSIILNIKIKQVLIGYCFISFDYNDEYMRTFRIDYLSTEQNYYFMSIVDHVCKYIWRNDPAEQIKLSLVQYDSYEVKKIIGQICQYFKKENSIIQKQNESTRQKIITFKRIGPQILDYNLYSKDLIMKIQVLFQNLASFQSPINQSNRNQLQYSTSYIFLIQQIFRNYLTPQQLIHLRQNTNNQNKLKHIFQIILQLEKNKTTFPSFKVLQANNLQHLYQQISSHLQKPHQRYYLTQQTKQNNQNLILGILEIKLQFNFKINSVIYNNKYFFRMQIKNQIQLLTSSINPQEFIYIIPTKNENINMFLLKAKAFRQMRLQLFVFLNIIFKNLKKSEKRYIQNFWIRQLIINKNEGKKYQKKRINEINDFSITLKKKIWLSQDVYFCNKQYIKNSIKIKYDQKDLIFDQEYIYGVLSSQMENESVGVPLYAKLISKQQHLT